MNVQLSQTIIVGLVVVACAVLRALGVVSEDLTAGVLVGGLGWAGGHAAGVATGRAATLSQTAQRYFGGKPNE